MPRVSILIVSYNTREMTLECLRSVRAETRSVRHEILVVDNASSDGSADAIAAEFADVRLIRSEENLGFAAANNLAAERATGEQLLLLNPDTVVLDRAIDALVEFADRNADAKIWGGRTLYGDRSLNPTSCFARMTPWSVFCRLVGLNLLWSSSELFNSELYGAWQRDRVRRVDIVTGCYLLIGREFWNELGGFDPAFFMYGEEVDLCLRAAKRGARPLFTPDSSIVHYGGASDSNRPDRTVAIFRARITNLRRHWPALQRPLGLAMFWCIPLSRAIGYGLAGFVLRRRRRVEQGRNWLQIWRRRGEWFGGFASRAAPG